MWGKYKENGFWIARKNIFKFLLDLDRMYWAFFKLRFRLILLENVRI